MPLLQLTDSIGFAGGNPRAAFGKSLAISLHSQQVEYRVILGREGVTVVLTH